MIVDLSNDLYNRPKGIKMENIKEKNKLKSRKFWFAAIWTAFVFIGFVTTIITKIDLSYMGTLITFSGTIVAAYIGGQSFIDSRKK